MHINFECLAWNSKFLWALLLSVTKVLHRLPYNIPDTKEDIILRYYFWEFHCSYEPTMLLNPNLGLIWPRDNCAFVLVILLNTLQELSMHSPNLESILNNETKLLAVATSHRAKPIVEHTNRVILTPFIIEFELISPLMLMDY